MTSDLATEPDPKDAADDAAKTAKLGGKVRHGGARAAMEIEEVGGPEGPEPTRYGDWEVGGRCTDF